MRKPFTGLLAAAALVAGVAGCSLPEVLPLAGGTTSGPSPYGPWYEQHWATNAVLLAATDEPGGEAKSDDVAAFEENPGIEEEALGGADVQAEPAAAAPAPAVVEIKAHPVAHSADSATDFDNSSPYQFPASAFAPKPGEDVPATEPHSSEKVVPPPSGGPIRY